MKTQAMLLLVAACFVSAPTVAQNAVHLATSSVSTALTENADAIVRLDETKIEIFNPAEAKVRFKRIVTVLNEKGRKYGVAVVGYDKTLFMLQWLNGKLYDASGNHLRNLESGDVKDFSAISGGSLYEDSRVRVGELYHGEFPYTVEYEYEVYNRAIFNLPKWFPEETSTAVERSRFEVQCPKSIKLMWRACGGDLNPKVSEKDGRDIYVWEVSNLLPFKPEELGPDFSEQAKSVRVIPATFEVEGVKGTATTWKEFGAWQYTLWKGRDELPDAVKADVKALIADVKTEREKVQKLYEYLQAKVRYISVQLGIGGWQPFDARYVAERGYGDCKALTNFMLALCKEAKLPAYPALIKSGDSAPTMLTDFPSNQFDHVICFVPLKKDTIWLECTSQNLLCGRLSDFTENRYALALTRDGGVLVRTPSTPSQKNLQQRRISVTLNESGSGTATVKTLWTGNQQDDQLALVNLAPIDKEKWVITHVRLPSFRLTAADFSDIQPRQDAISMTFSLDLPRYASVSGKRLFFQPNLLERGASVPPDLKERKYPVRRSYGYLDIDTVSYTLPPGFAVETSPTPTVLEKSFARYSSNVTVHGNTLTYTRLMEFKSPEIPAVLYKDYQEFMRQVVQADNAKVVLVKK